MTNPIIVTSPDDTNTIVQTTTRALAIVVGDGGVNVGDLKTVNGESLVGAGDVTISAVLADGVYGDVTVSSNGAIMTVAGAGGTNLSYTAATRLLASSTGADVTFPLADGTDAGLMSAAGFTKLAGVATGATANATNAALRDRDTHTGTQQAATISDFAEAVDDRVAALVVAGSNATVTYNDAAGTLTVAANPTNLSYTAATRLLASSTGADVTLPLVNGTDAGLSSSAEYIKLAGIPHASAVTYGITPSAIDNAARLQTAADDMTPRGIVTLELGDATLPLEAIPDPHAIANIRLVGGDANFTGNQPFYKWIGDRDDPAPALSAVNDADPVRHFPIVNAAYAAGGPINIVVFGDSTWVEAQNTNISHEAMKINQLRRWAAKQWPGVTVNVIGRAIGGRSFQHWNDIDAGTTINTTSYPWYTVGNTWISHVAPASPHMVVIGFGRNHNSGPDINDLVDLRAALSSYDLMWEATGLTGLTPTAEGGGTTINTWLDNQIGAAGMVATYARYVDDALIDTRRWTLAHVHGFDIRQGVMQSAVETATLGTNMYATNKTIGGQTLIILDGATWTAGQFINVGIAGGGLPLTGSFASCYLNIDKTAGGNYQFQWALIAGSTLASPVFDTGIAVPATSVTLIVEYSDGWLTIWDTENSTSTTSRAPLWSVPYVGKITQFAPYVFNTTSCPVTSVRFRKQKPTTYAPTVRDKDLFATSGALGGSGVNHENALLSQIMRSLWDTLRGGGNQKIALTGDVIGSGTGSFAATVAGNAITNAKLADVATSTIKGRVTAGTGDPEDLTSAQVRTLINVADGANNYVHPNHSGDVTSVGDGALTLATVNGNVGSFGLAASVAQFTVNAKGLITSAVNVAISVAATAISDSTAAGRAMLTAATAAAQTALLDTFTSALKGLVPASGGGTTNYLRADGTWAVPPGSGGGTVTFVSGASGAAGATDTRQVLAADASAITVTSLTDVLSLTDVGAGTWNVEVHLRYHSAATTTGLSTAINHSGTVTSFISQSAFVSTGGAAATGIADQVASVNAGQLVEGKSERVKNTASSATAGVDTINADMYLILNAMMVVTVSGTLAFRVASEVAASGITPKAGTHMILRKIA